MWFRRTVNVPHRLRIRTLNAGYLPVRLRVGWSRVLTNSHSTKSSGRSVTLNHVFHVHLMDAGHHPYNDSHAPWPLGIDTPDSCDRHEGWQWIWQKKKHIIASLGCYRISHAVLLPNRAAVCCRQEIPFGDWERNVNSLRNRGRLPIDRVGADTKLQTGQDSVSRQKQSGIGNVMSSKVVQMEIFSIRRCGVQERKPEGR
jgi:hypothetical protein